MFRPQKMQRIEMTVLRNDVDAVIEYLGRRAVMDFGEVENAAESAAAVSVRELLDKLRSGAEYLGVALPAEPEAASALPGEADAAYAKTLCAAVDALKARETAARQEQQKTGETFNEAKAFANLNAPFSDLDQLSYLTLRVGHLDPAGQAELKERLADRAVIIPLGGEGGNRVLAASSRKGRFALDSELKKNSFEAIAIPEGYQGVPDELLSGLEGRLAGIEKDIAKIIGEKEQFKREAQAALVRLASSLLMSLAAERLKSRLVSTASVYLLSGWVPQAMVRLLAADLAKITGGRTAIRVYSPNEIPSVREGGEKVPVSLKHGAFVKGFEGMVFSYGAPLYGTIDPTPLVAVFFTLLFGIMFGDLGQGFVLLLAGILTGKYGPKFLSSRFRGYSTPLIAVGISSMVMGFLAGEVFTNEELLLAPTRAITGALFGEPADRFLHILPLAEKGGSVTKLFYFFGFTISIGIIINSIGLVINIVNCCVTKKYATVFFGKTGLAGLLLFWYAISIALRGVFGGRFGYYDVAGIAVPVLCIFFGPLIWRCIAREKPVLEHGFLTFVIEGFVEILETVSNYISNTVSFLRVGAFALSHAVLAYIVFHFTEELTLSGGLMGPVSATLLAVFGNTIIIVLEGMIVAIQVVRLQYYEFFSKFFTETGVEFSPFRFRKKTQ